MRDAAVLIYGMRRALRDGDEKGVRSKLDDFSKFSNMMTMSSSASNTNMTTNNKTSMSQHHNNSIVALPPPPVWWETMSSEIDAAKQGMEAVRIARDLCQGLDTNSPSVAILERATKSAEEWLNRMPRDAQGKRLVERLNDASERVLELRHALLRGDEYAIHQCLDPEVAIEPLVRFHFTYATIIYCIYLYYLFVHFFFFMFLFFFLILHNVPSGL